MSHDSYGQQAIQKILCSSSLQTSLHACKFIVFSAILTFTTFKYTYIIKLSMDSSFFVKLKEVVSQAGQESESSSPSLSTCNTTQSPEPQLNGKQSTILVRFYGDKISRRYDPAFLKYSLEEVVCENEEEKQVMASHCCEQNAGFFHEIGNKAEELKCYQMMLKENPESLPALSKSAQLNFEMGRLEESIKYYSIINALYPNNAQAYFNLAVNYRTANRLNEAKLTLEKYIELAPSDSEGYKEMAEIMIELGKQHSAVQVLLKCMGKCPKDSYVLNTLGNLYLSTNPERAIECYLQGIIVDPENSNNFNGLGVIYNSMGWHERAIPEFERAIALKPAEADFHYNLALAHKELDQVFEAERSFKTALQADPTHYLSYEGLGNLSQQAHLFIKAIGYYELALQACPDFYNAMYNLALAHQHNKDLPKAAECLKRYLHHCPTDFNAYHQLATIRAALHCKEREAREQEPKAPLPKFLKSREGPGKCPN